MLRTSQLLLFDHNPGAWALRVAKAPGHAWGVVGDAVAAVGG